MTSRIEEELKGLRVLIADDDPINVAILRFFLQPSQAHCSVVRNGQEALRAILAPDEAPAAFDFIIMDMQMPVMNGWEATKRLRANGVQIPIIALSAFPTQSDRVRCLSEGCDAILTKPVSRTELFATIRQLPSLTPRVQASEPQEIPSPNNTGSNCSARGPDRFAELVARFRLTLAKTLDSIAEAESRADTVTLGTLVHRISGTAGNYGYPAISAAAAECENNLLQSNELQSSGPSLSSLKSLIAHAVSSAK